ncbi:hypothetical protein J6590_001045 [Homalodisca vitripennis]|nr:hypothetical protein J6590_001045 [Homalodisca vitripennis]
MGKAQRQADPGRVDPGLSDREVTILSHNEVRVELESCESASTSLWQRCVRGRVGERGWTWDCATAKSQYSHIMRSALNWNLANPLTPRCGNAVSEVGLEREGGPWTLQPGSHNTLT